jgi:hypothetical protein
MFTPSHPVGAAAQRSPGLEVPKALPVTMMAVCDAEGTVVWFRSEEILVLEIDGVTPAAILVARDAYR